MSTSVHQLQWDTLHQNVSCGHVWPSVQVSDGVHALSSLGVNEPDIHWSWSEDQWCILPRGASDSKITGCHVWDCGESFIFQQDIAHRACKMLDLLEWEPCVGPGHPSSPCPFTSSSFPLFTFPFFHWLYLFSYFVHPFPFYQNSSTPFPGRKS